MIIFRCIPLKTKHEHFMLMVLLITKSKLQIKHKVPIKYPKYICTTQMYSVNSLGWLVSFFPSEELGTVAFPVGSNGK